MDWSVIIGLCLRLLSRCSFILVKSLMNEICRLVTNHRSEPLAPLTLFIDQLVNVLINKICRLVGYYRSEPIAALAMFRLGSRKPPRKVSEGQNL
jgi:hypothetical protein